MMKHSIVNLVEIKHQDSVVRIDAEYWHPEFIENSRLVSRGKKIGDFILKDIANIKSSPVNRDFEYLEISRISLNSCEYKTAGIAFGEEPDRAHHILRKGDVVVSTVRPNRNAVALIREDGIIGSSGLSVLRAKNLEPEYLFVFCKTDYFIKCLVRANRATMYPAVSNDDILDTPIFIASNNFRSLIIQIVETTLAQNRMAQQIYLHAQTLLLSNLGLTDWQPRHQLSFVKNYSEIKQAERIDAEYYQPKYDEIIKATKDYSGGHDILGNLVSLKAEDCEPNPKQEYKYIELANIAGNGEITGCMIEEGQSLPTRARRKVLTGDVIVSSIEGSLQSIALIQEEYNQALCSTGFHVINSKVFNSETLLVLLKSVVGQMQLKKGCNGTILTAINKYEFEKIVLPKITEEVQTQIQEKVVESFDLREQSKYLLACAKQAVEMAIEQDEQAAIKWLENKTKETTGASAPQNRRRYS